MPWGVQFLKSLPGPYFSHFAAAGPDTADESATTAIAVRVESSNFLALEEIAISTSVPFQSTTLKC